MLALSGVSVSLHGGTADAAQSGATPASLPGNARPGPGVYVQGDGQLLAVGQGRISQSMRQDRALRLAARLAERDAKTRLARHLLADAPPEQREQAHSLSLSGARTVFQEQRNGHVVLGLLVRADAVKLVSASPLEECFDVRVSPQAAAVLRQSPQLVLGGGAVLPQQETPGGWLGIGVGLAPLPREADSALEGQARTVALANARSALTAAIYGRTVTVDAGSSEIVATGPGGDALRQWQKSTYTENVQGVLKGAALAGEWKTADDSLAVMVLAGRPELALTGVPEGNASDGASQGGARLGSAGGNAASHAPEQEPDQRAQLAMAGDWGPVFAQRPWLHEGGASLYAEGGQAFVLVVEKGMLRGNPAIDNTQTPLLIETKARNAAVKYLAGVSSSARTVETEESLSQGPQGEETLRHALQTVAKENVLGVVQGMRKVGSWRDKENTALFLAFVVPLMQR